MRRSFRGFVGLGVLAGMLIWPAAHAATGRIRGQADVSATGAFTYNIPIWVPPGPHGVQPALSLFYNSTVAGSNVIGNGAGGVTTSATAAYEVPLAGTADPDAVALGPGWLLSGLSAIARCTGTIAQDGAGRAIGFTPSDYYCLDGSRLRNTGGTYGLDGSTYQTELADFSLVTAVGTTGYGPDHFLVRTKSGLIYEYGNTSDSKVTAQSSQSGLKIRRWLLNRVSDTSGNSYVVTYGPGLSGSAGIAVPTSISWTPSGAGSTSYNYTASFHYVARGASEAISGGFPNMDTTVTATALVNTNLLSDITISYSGTTVRYYKFNYTTSSVTQRSLLQGIQECADSSMTDCLSSTATYVPGAAGVSGSSASGVTNVSSVVGAYDFNGDGKSDILFNSGGTLYVAFSNGSGFNTAVSTGLSVSSSDVYYVADLLHRGAADILITRSGVFWRYAWSGNSFVGASTGISAPNSSTGPVGAALADVNGDGLPDLVTLSSTRVGSSGSFYNGTLTTYLNTSAGGTLSFSGSPSTYSLPGCTTATVGCVPYIQSAGMDINGDRRSDLIVATVGIVQSGQQYTDYWALLSQSTASTASYASTAVSSWQNLPQNSTGSLYLNWNDDRCTDLLNEDNVSHTNNSISIGACNGSVGSMVTFPGTVIGLTDWNGDHRTDVLVNNGGTLGIYTSTGSGISALISTGIPINGTVLSLDIDGDGLPDIAVFNGGTISYYLHNSVGQYPDLLSSVSDGYGNAISPSYVAISAGAYTPGTGAQDPEVNWIGALWVVQTLTQSDGAGNPYTLTYHYTDARQSRLRGFEGFAMRQVTDSRNGQVRQTSYDLLFPNTGMVRQDDLLQSDGSTLISHQLASNASMLLDSQTYQQRYFPYTSNVTTDLHEVGDSKNGQLITTTSTSYQSPDTYGNFGTITETITDQDSGSPFSSLQWTTTTSSSVSADGSANWCINQPTSVSVAKAAPGKASLTRTSSYAVDYTHCRPTSETISSGDSSYDVSKSFSYDGFGNMSQVTVTGAGMPTRTSTTGWGTTGQLPETLQDPVAYAAGYRTRRAYDYGKGLKTSEVVETIDGTTQNAPPTSWAYDHFGRVTGQTRPDKTSTTWSYTDCGSGCYNSNHRITVTQTLLDANGTPVSDQTTFLDHLERPLVTRKKLLDGSYSQVEQQYDALGRVAKRSAPCNAANCTVFWITPAYDAADRVTALSRPQSEMVATLQTSHVHYLGRTTTRQDPAGRTTTRILDVAGRLRQSQDDSGYYQNFDYDSLGTLTSVTDSSSNSLYAATYNYGLQAFPHTVTDRSLGSWTYAYDALGEMTGYTDANGNIFGMSYDALSRPLVRRDGITGASSQETLTQWIWGTTPSQHNVGQLESASTTAAAGTYTDTYSFDGYGRLAYRTINIPADNSYSYDYSYNAAGLLDTLTYPADASSYRLALKHCYANGLLQAVADTNCSGTPFWQANSVNSRGQITQNTLGNGVVTQRHFDAVTGWIATRVAGPASSPAALQNESYLFDGLGNLTQRQNNNLGLTENFFYDDLYRLDYSTLNNGSTTVTNLDPSYDSLGNILTKVETGGTAAPVAQTIHWTSYNYPLSITASVQNTNDQTATFYYGPNRERWRMDFADGLGSETTYHIGGLMEKAVLGGVADYRYYIYGADGLATIYSRKTSGTNAYHYALEDHLGSVASLLDASGNPVVSESFTAYGNRREASTWSGPPTSTEIGTMNAITRQGFTGQTVLGGMGLIHMNGRIEDAVTGVFLSADPYIPDLQNTQAFARYAYVYNSPLSYIDPSGFDLCFFAPNYGGDVQSDGSNVLVTGNRDGFQCIPDIVHPPLLPPANPPPPPPQTVPPCLQGDCRVQQANQNCPKVPTAPQGVDVNGNIQTAQTHNSTQDPPISTPHGPAPNWAAFERGPLWFYNQVNYGGPWDYKTQNPPGTQMYTDFGNFNFGATGRAVGFSATELLWGAGLAQLRHDLQNGNPPQGISTRFDNPDDPAPIEAGIQYYDNNCH
jgi:RHS repeat-associated protein